MNLKYILAGIASVQALWFAIYVALAFQFGYYALAIINLIFYIGSVLIVRGIAKNWYEYRIVKR